MGRVVFAIATVLILTAPAAAQSPVFVSGSFFGDVKRFSGDPATNVLDGDTIGGGARLGTFVAPSWTLELGTDVGGVTTIARDVPQLVGKTAALPPRRQSRTRNRLIATSALVGFHPGANRRVRFAYLGGLTLLHVTRKTDTLIAGVAQPNERDTVDFVPAATMGIEAWVAVSSHLGIVPEVRVFAFSLGGNGLAGIAGGIAIRPGIAIRWTF